MIPVSCFDNFYDDPDSIRDFALSLDFKPPRKQENFPGERTTSLSLIDENFHHFSVEKVVSSFFDSESIPECRAFTQFQKIPTFNSDRHHPMNRGWAHKDDDVPHSLLSAVVYLNKNTCLDSGTKILSLKKGHENYEFSDEDKAIRRSLYHKHFFGDKDVDQNLYSKAIQNHNSKFDTTIEFKNVYNRLIVYDGTLWHNQSSFWVPEEFRLTQVFFIWFSENVSLKKTFFKNLDYS